MSIGLCRVGRESGRINVSLLSASIKDAEIEEGTLHQISRALSTRLGFRTSYEKRMIHSHHLHETRFPPYHGPFGIPRVRKPGTRRFPRRYLNPSGLPKDQLDWAFIHRYREPPYSEQLPSKKSVSIFCRNASDECIPCTFHCPGCERGGVRITVSGLSSYDIDSEILGEAVIDCIASVLSSPVDIEYAKKGVLWSRYIPAAVRQFSGPWFNLAYLDYLHRSSGILSDFAYPVIPA